MSDQNPASHIPAFVIGGHPRSGTTLLTRLCAGHPDIGITFEFRSFYNLNVSKNKYIKLLRKSPIRRRLILDQTSSGSLTNRLLNARFLLHYIWQIYQAEAPDVKIETVATTLARLFPRAKVVGDKFPRYIHRLPRLCATQGLTPVIIYRDGRDVVNSILARAKRPNQKKWAKRYPDAGKAAKGWVRAINKMEHHHQHIHSLRYEDLILEPETTLKALAQRLGIDPEGFNVSRVHEKSVGKHHREMSPRDLAAVMKIAGPTLERLGYGS